MVYTAADDEATLAAVVWNARALRGSVREDSQKDRPAGKARAAQKKGKGEVTGSYHNATDVATARIDLVEKLLRRALDPAAEIGEAETSATMMVKVARREGGTFDSFASALVP